MHIYSFLMYCSLEFLSYRTKDYIRIVWNCISCGQATTPQAAIIVFVFEFDKDSNSFKRIKRFLICTRSFMVVFTALLFHLWPSLDICGFRRELENRNWLAEVILLSLLFSF